MGERAMMEFPEIVGLERSNPALPDRAATVYIGAIAEWSQRYDSTHLSADEQARAARFRRVRDADAFRARRFALRDVICALADLDSESVRLIERPGEKPRLASHPRGEIHFSVSRSDPYFAVAASTMYPLGVDVEGVEKVADWREFGSRVLTAPELSRLRGMGRVDADRAFAQSWCDKEAVLKAIGVGLVDELPELRTRLLGEGSAELLGLPKALRNEQVHLAHLDLPAGIRGALAVRATPKR